MDFQGIVPLINSAIQGIFQYCLLQFNYWGFWRISFEAQRFIFFGSIAPMITIGSDIPAGRITVRFPYSPEVVAKIKTVKTHQRHNEGKYWSFPYSKPVLDEMLTALAGEEVEIDPSLDTLTPPASADQLLEQVRHLIRLKHYSIRTEKSYLLWIQRYILFYNKRDPKEMGNSEIEAFLSYLAVTLCTDPDKSRHFIIESSGVMLLGYLSHLH